MRRRIETLQKFSDTPLTVHEKCGGSVHRLLSTSALMFKGSGWYVNDYAKGANNSKKGDSAEGSSASGKGDSGKADSGSTSKSTDSNSSSSSTPAASTSSSDKK